MCTNMPFKIYTENKYMGTLSLAIVSISISIAMGDGTETRSIMVTSYGDPTCFLNIKLWSLISIAKIISVSVWIDLPL